MTSYFDSVSVLAMDLVRYPRLQTCGTLPQSDLGFLAKHASRVTRDRLRRTFRGSLAQYLLRATNAWGRE